MDSLEYETILDNISCLFSCDINKVDNLYVIIFHIMYFISVLFSTLFQCLCHMFMAWFHQVFVIFYLHYCLVPSSIPFLQIHCILHSLNFAVTLTFCVIFQKKFITFKLIFLFNYTHFCYLCILINIMVYWLQTLMYQIFSQHLSQEHFMNIFCFRRCYKAIRIHVTSSILLP